jgi:hypothetical protein
MLRKNVSGQFLYFALVNATTGAALTGATVTARRSIDGAAQANCTGTVSEPGNGQYQIALSQADTNGNNIGYLFTATNAIPVSITATLTAADPTDAASFGITRIDAAITSRMATYTQPTGFLAATFPTGTIANTTNITGGTITTVSGNVNGSVGSVTGAVGSVTGNVGGTVASVVGDVGGNVVGTVASVVGNVTGSVGSVVGNVGGNLTGSVGSVVGNVGGDVVGSVGSVLGNLGGNVTGSVGSVLGNLGGNVTGSVGSVTGLNVAFVDAAISSRQPSGAVALTTAGNEAVADALLNRNVEGGSNTGALVKEGFYFLRLKWNTTDTPGVLTVYREDGTTVAWTRALAVDPTADPITGLT